MSAALLYIRDLAELHQAPQKIKIVYLLATKSRFTTFQVQNFEEILGEGCCWWAMGLAKTEANDREKIEIFCENS